jgi:hypothetical protein
MGWYRLTSALPAQRFAGKAISASFCDVIRVGTLGVFFFSAAAATLLPYSQGLMLVLRRLPRMASRTFRVETEKGPGAPLGPFFYGGA